MKNMTTVKTLYMKSNIFWSINHPGFWRNTAPAKEREQYIHFQITKLLKQQPVLLCWTYKVHLAVLHYLCCAMSWENGLLSHRLMVKQEGICPRHRSGVFPEQWCLMGQTHSLPNNGFVSKCFAILLLQCRCEAALAHSSHETAGRALRHRAEVVNNAGTTDNEWTNGTYQRTTHKYVGVYVCIFLLNRAYSKSACTNTQDG